MPSVITMNDKQKCAAGLTVMDQDGQPYSAVPPGATVLFESSDPTVADFEEDDTGLAGTVTSGKVGQATITGTVTLADGRVLSDQLMVNVTLSDPASANFTVGTPVDE